MVWETNRGRERPRMRIRRVATMRLAPILAAAILLSGCGSPTHATQPASTATPTATASSYLAEVQAAVKAAGQIPSLITAAAETEPGRLQVDTILKDSQSAVGVALCEAIVKAHPDRWTYLVIQDADRTALATYGHPRNPKACASV